MAPASIPGAAASTAPASGLPIGEAASGAGPASGGWGPASAPAHAPMPSQYPRSPHSPSGSVIAGTIVQDPTDPGTLQDSQVPVHASEQQMRSTHEPESHSSSRVQLEAFARRSSQMPEGAQYESPGHSPSAHEDAHVVPSAQ